MDYVTLQEQDDFVTKIRVLAQKLSYFSESELLELGYDHQMIAAARLYLSYQDQ